MSTAPFPSSMQNSSDNYLPGHSTKPDGPNSALDTQRLFGLDLVRSLAILLVLFCHLEALIAPPEGYSHYFHYAGFQGVELFFTLSGFLIGRIMLDHPIYSLKSLWLFLARRWMRTLPAFGVAAVCLMLYYAPAIKDAILILCFSANTLPRQSADGLAFFTVSWSLAIEEQFYLLLGLYVLVSRNTSILNYACIWLFLVSVRSAYLGFSEFTFNVSHMTTWLRFDALIIGVIAAASYKYFVPTRHRLIVRTTWTAGLLLGFLIWSAHPWIQYSSAAFSALFMPLNSLAISLLVLDMASPAHRHTRTPATLVASTIAALSYSLYLYHLDVIRFIQKYMGSGLLPTILGIVASFLIAGLSQRLVERPMLKLRDRIFPYWNGDGTPFPVSRHGSRAN